jgi:diadenosine tetraphosphatase ApaH/serine/threonine PP2A family protein phosphatase
MIANPGSVGQSRDGNPKASFGILTISKEKHDFDIVRVEYDVDATATEILDAGLPRFLADRLHVGI